MGTADLGNFLGLGRKIIFNVSFVLIVYYVYLFLQIYKIPKSVSRNESIGSVQRIKINNEKIEGSISLKGGIIDDLIVYKIEIDKLVESKKMKEDYTTRVDQKTGELRTSKRELTESQIRRIDELRSKDLPVYVYGPGWEQKNNFKKVGSLHPISRILEFLLNPFSFFTFSMSLINL